MNTMDRDQLKQILSDTLDVESMVDYCPNGLQVEGKKEIRKLFTGVTASREFLELAVNKGADAVLVHHGLMWKGDPQVVTGFRKARLQLALGADLNVFAYHLPLDVHPELGNNVQLGSMLGWPTDRLMGKYGLIRVGQLPQSEKLGNLLEKVEHTLGRTCALAGRSDRGRLIQTVAWCTGGAASYVEEAGLSGADLYLTGELSEPAVHVASELGVSLLGAGHHATERCGVEALGKWLALQHGLTVEFHDLFVCV